ncbi:MAG: NUDIX domain-containing protein [Gaiellales bacterium]
MVDERGDPIGTATRAACHADPSLVHLSLHVIVLAADGVLWQLRGPYKDSAPNAWDHACSGHVSAGETVRQSAVRELAEEVGIDVAEDDLVELARVRCPLDGETELTTVFQLCHPGPYRLAPPELAGLAVLPAGERPAPLSQSCATLTDLLDAEHPGWDRR